MGALEAAGWKKAEEKKHEEITEDDIRAIFNMVDIDKSGSVSKWVSSFMLTNRIKTFVTRKLVWLANSFKRGLGSRM